MRRTTPAVLALLLVVSAVAAVPVVVAQQSETEPAQTAGNDSVAPGARLSGVVAVGEAELDGEVQERAYGIRLADANTTAARAAVVADQYNDTRQRVAELAAERAALERARENGTLSEGEYRARVAALHTESRTAQRLATRTSETAATLPAQQLEANGVNSTAVRSLRDRAANLTGPETAAIARSVAGENAGQPVRPDEASNATATGEARTPAGTDRSGTAEAPSAPEPGSSAATDATTSTATGP